MKNILKLVIHAGENIQDTVNKVYEKLEENGPYDCAEITLNGCFYITEPIRFPAGCTFPVTLIGGENAVVDGGWHIKGFRETRMKGVPVWYAKVDAQRAKQLRFDQLFVNRTRRYRPIYPENCFMRLTGIILDGDEQKPMLLEEKEKYWCKSNHIFSYEGNLPSFSRIQDMVLTMNHCWLHERLRISNIDYENKLIYTDSLSLFAAFPDEKIYLENVFEAFEKPGQWYFDTGKECLYYLPKEGESLAGADIVIPAADAFLIAENVSNKHIQGIAFQYCSSRYAYGVIRPERSRVLSIETNRQGECEVPGCIQFVHAKHCSVKKCTIAHVGRYGIEIAKKSAHIAIDKNCFHDLGTGAVKTYRRDAFAVSAPEDETSHVQITDNEISYYGMLYKAAVGILLTDVNHYTVAHNEIHHGEYSAISCGWVWGYHTGNAGHNKISYNHIYCIGNNSLCDMGAIYMLGVQPCTEIKNNLIHDVVDREKNGWGIYLDEGSSHITVENNIVYRISTEAIHIHYGKDNRVINNIFAFADVALLSNTRYEPHLQMVVEKNIFYSENGQILRIMKGEGAIETDKNLYFSKTGTIGFCHNNYEKEMVYLPYTQWKETGNDRFSMECDPLFEDVEKDCFQLRPNSPAYQLGFRNIDLRLVGIRK